MCNAFDGHARTPVAYSTFRRADHVPVRWTDSMPRFAGSPSSLCLHAVFSSSIRLPQLVPRGDTEILLPPGVGQGPRPAGSPYVQYGRPRHASVCVGGVEEAQGGDVRGVLDPWYASLWDTFMNELSSPALLCQWVTSVSLSWSFLALSRPAPRHTSVIFSRDRAIRSLHPKNQWQPLLVFSYFIRYPRSSRTT